MAVILRYLSSDRHLATYLLIALHISDSRVFSLHDFTLSFRNCFFLVLLLLLTKFLPPRLDSGLDGEADDELAGDDDEDDGDVGIDITCSDLDIVTSSSCKEFECSGNQILGP